MKMLKSVVCLVLVGGFVLGLAVDSNAASSHNWRSWAVTTGYVEGKAGAWDAGCCPMMGGCGCGCLSTLVCGVLSLPMCLVNSVFSALSCLMPCGIGCGTGCGPVMGGCGCKW